MDALMFFSIGALGVLLSGYIARWIVSHFLRPDMAAVAGFSFVFGGGSVGFGSGFNASSQVTEIAMAIGSISGLVLVWWLFFKREPANG